MPDLPAAFADWPQDARDWFEERAAIREHEGRLPRVEAERLAEDDTRRWWRTTRHEVVNG